METIRPHVLIVEDELIQRRAITATLLRRGFDCDEAQDGQEALTRARRQHYDAIVTDLRMPELHGDALCRELLSLPEPPVVIVVTALDDPRLREDLLGRGVKAYFTKPVKLGLIAEAALSEVKDQPVPAWGEPSSPYCDAPCVAASGPSRL